MLRGLASLFKKKKKEPEVKPEEKASGKTDWAGFLADELGITREEAQKRLDYIKRDFGISPASYCRNRFFEISESAMAMKYRRQQVLLKIRKQKYEEIKELTGKDRKQVRAEVRKIKAKEPGFRVDPDWYYNNGAYLLDPDSKEMEDLLALCRRKEDLKKTIGEKLEEIDSGRSGYGSIEDQLNEYSELTKQTLSDLKRKRLEERFGRVLTGMDPEKADRVITDIETTYQLLGFSQEEYLSYHFWDRPFSEKREYVSSEQRAKIIDSLNTQEGSDLLNDKYGAYCRLKSLYGREAVLLDSDNGPETLKEFCSRHSSFVKKHNYDSLGRGVARVDLKPEEDPDDLYAEVTADGGRVLLEELIEPAPEIRRLNPDSVNTVRIITFLDGEEPLIQDAFMKIGRKGSFIDNGGAGGIFVHVDPVTGVFDSNGIDEQCTEYECHPDHGYCFKGIQLPDWNEAVNTAKAAALMVPEARYVGWDLTCNESGKWIIVEGNAKTQFFAQQMTRGRGIKREFFDSIHYDIDRFE